MNSLMRTASCLMQTASCLSGNGVHTNRVLRSFLLLGSFCKLWGEGREREVREVTTTPGEGGSGGSGGGGSSPQLQKSSDFLREVFGGQCGWVLQGGGCRVTNQQRLVRCVSSR